MKAYKKFGLLSAILALGAMLVASGDLLAGDPLPDGGPKDEHKKSLGMYRISIVEKFHRYFDYYPGYDSATGKLESPTLYDPNTRIGISPLLSHGDSNDIKGVPVGTDLTWIADTSFTVVPPNWQGPDGTPEIHTDVARMDMWGPNDVLILAGFKMHPSLYRVSPGEVETLEGGTLPGQSFFNVFVEVHIPRNPYINWGPDSGMVVVNNTALLVMADTVNSIPPRVCYIHGNTKAVPVYFAYTNTDSTYPWQAGDMLGYIVLAGHGFDFDDSPEDMAEFESIMGEQEEMPLPKIPTLTEWGLIIFCVLLFGWMAWVIVRRRRRVTAGI